MALRTVDRLSEALAAHLDGKPITAPEGASVIWNAFMALSRARSSGPSGPNPIGFPEIDAWSRLMQMPLEPHHVQAITAMDQVWLQHCYRRWAGGGPKEDLSAAAFDAFMG